jgi:hypothetical protein
MRNSTLAHRLENAESSLCCKLMDLVSSQKNSKKGDLDDERQ